MPQNIFLEKDDIIITPIEEDEAKQISVIYNEPSVRKYSAPNKPLTKEEVMEFKSEENTTMFAVKRKGQERVVGSVELIIRDKAAGVAEIGYAIDPEFQGEGIGTKSVGMVVNYGFQELNLKKIYGEVDKPNMPSAKLLKNLGFEKDAELDSHGYLEGERVSKVIYAKIK